MLATSITTCHGCGKTLCTRGYADAPGKHEWSCRNKHRIYSPDSPNAETEGPYKGVVFFCKVEEEAESEPASV